MTPAENDPAKMRHRRHWTDGGAAILVLEDGLEALRPWTDTAAVASLLQAWLDQVSGRRVEGGREHDVAQELRRLGHWEAQLDSESVGGIAFHMLRNVLNRRAPTNYGLDEVIGLPERTKRRYVEKYGVGAVGAVLRRLQYEIDLATLVAGGRSAATARRWLARHPGERPSTASPPRRRGGVRPLPGARSGPCGPSV